MELAGLTKYEKLNLNHMYTPGLLAEGVHILFHRMSLASVCNLALQLSHSLSGKSQCWTHPAGPATLEEASHCLQAIRKL